MIKVKCFDCGKEFEIIENQYLTDRVYAGVDIEFICDGCETIRKEKHEKDIAIKKKEAMEFRLKRFLNFAGERYRDACLEKSDIKTFNFIGNFIKQFDNFKTHNIDNRGLLFFGGVGLGKTHLLFAMFRYLYVDKNINTMIIRMNTLLRVHHALTFGNYPKGFESIYELISDRNDVEYLNKDDFVEILSEIPILIIDEMSRIKASEFNLNFLIEVLDNRYNRCMVTILCGNVAAAGDLRKNLMGIFNDEAIVSRIMDKNWNNTFFVFGEDKRK